MSLAQAVHLVAVDLDQLIRLFRQLLDVPSEVTPLFELVRSVHALLLNTKSTLAKQNVSVLFDDYVTRFKSFRTTLLDLELFIDPDQTLPRSGPNSDDVGVVPWAGPRGVAAVEFYNSFQSKLKDMETCCASLISALPLSNDIDRPQTPPRPQLEPATLPPSKLDALIQAQYNLLTPLLSPVSSPLANPLPSFVPISYFSLSDSPFPVPIPPPSNPGHTLANLPSSKSATVKRKKRDRTLAEKRIQELIQLQYSRPFVAGVKRKRREDAQRGKNSLTPTFPATQEETLIPLNAPPKYCPSSPRLGPQDIPDDNPKWSLDDLGSVLPTISIRDKGKQRAPQPLLGDSSDSWDTSSSIHTGSSANSIRSSQREGSIFSTASRDRMYEEGACKLFYRHGKGTTQLSIVHIEVIRSSVPSGDCISIFSRMPDKNVIRDDLFVAALRSNAAPFFEHADIVTAMRAAHGNDRALACVVKFAPKPADHPQYGFASVQDAWDFMQHVVGRMLCCSVNVLSIKSAYTHGNAVESGTETLQIWEALPEDNMAIITTTATTTTNTNGTPTSPISRARTRTVKFFRNKNSNVQQQVVEFDCNALRPPDVDTRSGKVSFRFRDVREGVVKDMRYLKIQFSGEEDRIDFLHEVGFSEHIPGPKS